MTVPSMLPVPEQRKASRVSFQAHVEIDLAVASSARTDKASGAGPPHLEANSLNLSEHGMCLRVQEALEVRSRIRLRVFPAASKKPLECAGQVAWVVQRMDLRDTPPFVYDIGVRFIDPPARLRQFASRVGVAMKSLRSAKQPALESLAINGRRYLPRLERESASGLWHLVVWVDGAPCFGHRYPSQRQAVEGWEQFKRHTATQNRLVRHQAIKPQIRRR